MNILMVLTSHDQLGNTGAKTGFWLEEFAAPYYVFKDAGANITLASPQGGQPPLDPNSDAPAAQTAATERFRHDDDSKALLANTVMLSSISADDFDAVFYPGGHGPLWDLTNDQHSIQLIETMAAAGKLVSAVCHAPSVLLHTCAQNGTPLIKDRMVTGFSNTEEEAIQLTTVVPFLLEDALKAKGARYTRADDWQSHAVTDGVLVTGQNPASSEAVARAVLDKIR